MVEMVVEGVVHGGQGGRGRCRGDAIKRKKIVKDGMVLEVVKFDFFQW